MNHESKPEVLSLYDFFKKFPSEESARLFFENKRWANGTYCPHCGSCGVSECVNHKPMPYRCKDCRKHFSVRTGTTLEASRLPLQKWLMAIYMMTTARKGIPSTQMARELGVTQKSAWFLAQRIRESWLSNQAENNDKLDGDIEVDETYIGGKEKNKHADKKIHAGRGAVGKLIVVGMKQRNGAVIVKRAFDTTAKTLQSFIGQNVKQGANVYTDSYGIFHYMSFKHLHRYINEFAFRHNTASLGTMAFIEATVSNMSNRRLTYKRLINA